ncbi:MAG: TetR/AcrR family transcriptional regulator [Burkholderiales bacterium]
MRTAVVAKVKDEALVRARRRQIVDAAVHVFLEKSYHVATVGDVAARVGISQGAMYTYVRSKDDILYMICDETVDAHFEAVERALQGVRDPEARLKAAIAGLVESIWATRRSTLVVYREAHDLLPQSIKALLAKSARFTALFEEMLQDLGRFEASESRMVVANIVTYLPTVIANRAWYVRDRVPRERFVAEITSFLLRGLGLADAVVPMPARRERRGGKA